MTIWLLAALLFLLLAGLGFLMGAIRTMVLVLGVWVGAKLAMPLGNVLEPYLPKLGIESPFWMEIAAPWAAFFVIQFIFLILAFLVHWKIAKYFRFQTDEVTQLKWARLLRFSGLAFGLVMGVGYLILTSYFVYFVGYLTTQLTSDSNPPKGFDLITQARQDLTTTGMDRFIAKRDTMPPNFYKAVDILGLIYHNPLLHHRLSGYPPFLSLAERSEFKAIAGDSSLTEMLQTQGDFTRIYDHPKIQTLLSSSDLKGELEKLDLEDLERYLKTGETEVYDERFVGRWKLDNYLTTRDLRKQLVSLPASTAKLVRKALLLVEIKMVNTLEGQSIIKVDIPADAIAKMVEEAAAKSAASNAARANAAAARAAQLAAQQQQAAQQSTDANSSRFQDRYGVSNQPEPRNQAPVQTIRRTQPSATGVDPAAKATELLGQLSKSAKGQWSKTGHKYAVSVKENGQTNEMEARIVEGDLILINGDMRLTFYKN